MNPFDDWLRPSPPLASSPLPGKLKDTTWYGGPLVSNEAVMGDDMDDMDHVECFNNHEFDLEEQGEEEEWDIFQDDDCHEREEEHNEDMLLWAVPATATLRQQPQSPLVPFRGIRFASIIATNAEDGSSRSSTLPTKDLLDLMGGSTWRDHHRSTLPPLPLTFPGGSPGHHCHDSFDIFEQHEPETITTTTTTTTPTTTYSTQQRPSEGGCECFCEEDPFDDDNASQMSEGSDHLDTTQRGRQHMMYSAGGTGALALLGWATYKLLHMLDKTNNLEDDTAAVGGQLSGNVNATDTTIQLAEANQTVIVNTDILSHGLSRTSIHSGGSVGGGSVSAGSVSGGSASAGSTGGGSILYVSPGTEQLLVNPALNV